MSARQMGTCSKKELITWGHLSDVPPSLQAAKVHFPPLDNAKLLCSGGCAFAVVVSDSGKLYAWGEANDYGQCGPRASGQAAEVPGEVPLPGGHLALAAAAGPNHVVAVTEQGQVFTWGWTPCLPASAGEDAEPRIECKGLGATEGLGSDWTAPASESESFKRKRNQWEAGRRHPGGDSPDPSRDESEVNKTKSGESGPARCALDKDDSAVDHGRRIRADGASGNREHADARWRPLLVPFAPGVRIRAVAAGASHTLALSEEGGVWGWGRNSEGQLGLGRKTPMVGSPARVPCLGSAERRRDGRGDAEAPCGESSSERDRTLVEDEEEEEEEEAEGEGRAPGSRVVAIACGARHSALVSDQGALLTCGWGLYGQCGHGTTDDELSMRHVAALGGLGVAAVAAGLWHTVALTEAGDVFSWGGNQFGQLGVGGTTAEVRPRLVEAKALEDETVVQIACGARHTAALTETGQVFSWGWNKFGQLGLGDHTDRAEPTRLPLAHVGEKLSCGWWHTLVLVRS